MRENASTTRKPAPTGRATSSRQLFVPRSSAARWRAKRCTTRGDAAVPSKSSGARGSGRNATSAAAPTGPAARGSSRCHAGVVAPPPTDPLLLSGFSTAGVPSRSHSRPAMLAQPGSKSKPRKCLRFQPGRPSTQRRVGMISDDRVSARVPARRSGPPIPVGGSSNGRTADFDSASLGSNPSPPANAFSSALSTILQVKATNSRAAPLRARLLIERCRTPPVPP